MFRICRFTLFLIILVIAGNAKSSNLKNGYDALREYDYFKAKKIFESNLEKQFVGAGYGLAIIFSSSNNPFYNLDSSHFLIKRVWLAFIFLPEKQQLKLVRYQIDSVAILNLSNRIDSISYSITTKDPSAEKLKKFIRDYQGSKEIDEAIKIRNKLVYEIVYNENTIQAYSKFISKYPYADEVSLAR